MHFLPDVYVPCDVCHGKRYNRETLEIRYRGFNISDVLQMTVEDALRLFEPVPSIARKLETLVDVGLSYIKLGQSATTLSGGEAQRVKLSRELSRRDTGRTLYILDEPTTGLHFHDIEALLGVLHKLRDEGNTVVVIEHNLDVIKTADWIVDLGPEGGHRGGTILVSGTPEDVAAHKASYTGQFLAKMLPSVKSAPDASGGNGQQARCAPAAQGQTGEGGQGRQIRHQEDCKEEGKLMSEHKVLARITISVRWRDMDSMGHVNNAKYISYLEEARVRWMLGVQGVAMTDRIAPVVAATNVNYKQPLIWPNDITVELFVERLGTSSVTIGHRIFDQKDDSKLYSDGNVVVVWIDTQTGKTAALPDAVRAASS